MSTRLEACDREIQRVNDEAKDAFFKVFQDRQKRFHSDRAQDLTDKILKLVSDEDEAFKKEDLKWEENHSRQLSSVQAESLRKEGIRERLPTAVSNFTLKLYADADAGMSPEDASKSLELLRTTKERPPVWAGGGAERLRTPDAQLPDADRSTLITPPASARDAGGPSGLKRTRGQFASENSGDQIRVSLPTPEENVRHSFYPVTSRHDALALGLEFQLTFDSQSASPNQLPAKPPPPKRIRMTSTPPSRRAARGIDNPLRPCQHPE